MGRHVRGPETWGLGLAMLLATAAPALAHGSARGFVLLLPTDRYLAGGAAVVALTFLLLVALPSRSLPAWPGRRSRVVNLPCPDPALASLGSFALLCVLVAAGLFGTRDPVENPLPVAIWSLWWTGFTLACALLGDLWRVLDPWSGPYALLDRACGGRLSSRPPLHLPERLGAAPAMALFFAFAWFELVHPAPDDPEILARAVIAYWLVTFAGMLLFGPQEWRARGEPFSTFFAAIGRLSPLDWERKAGRLSLALCWPGARLLSAPALEPSRALLILVALATVSFDALAQTFTWMQVGSVNPLEYPGRSAMMVQNTIGLPLAMLVLPAAYAVAVWRGWRCSGRRGTLAHAVGRFVHTLVPIALGLHIAHFLPAFLVEVQYAFVAASDPFGTGADLFGTAHYEVVSSFLSTLEGVTVLWNVQTAAVVLGHVWAVVLAHAMAVEERGGALATKLCELPLAVLMVAYTALGLWLLSTPVVG